MINWVRFLAFFSTSLILWTIFVYKYNIKKKNIYQIKREDKNGVKILWLTSMGNSIAWDLQKKIIRLN